MTLRARNASRTFYELSGLRVRKELRASQLRLWDLAAAGTVNLPRHRHESAHFVVLVKGEMTCSCLARPYAPWTAVFHPPGVEHRLQLSGGFALVLEVGRRWLDRLDDHAPPPAAPRPLDPSARWVTTRLAAEFRSLRPASILVIEGLTAQLLAAAARSVETGSGDPYWLPRLLERLHAEFDRNLQLNELAAWLAVHPNRLSRSFRRVTGRRIGEYVRDLRVKYVLDRLSQGEASLVELALSAGFCDQSHCTRDFKRVTGTTPAAYRAWILGGRAGGELRPDVREGLV